MAFIIVKSGDAEDVGKTFTLNKPVAVIGRRTSQHEPDIELNGDVISRRHIEILFRDDRFWVKDLGSTNGTMLNDDRIIAGNLYELKHDSKIGLGVEGTSAHTVLVFKESESTNIIHKKRSQAGKHGEALTVAWLKIDEAKKEVVIDGEEKNLSKKEYELLLFLYKNAGNVCSRDEIIEAVWPESKDHSAISDATIDQLIHRLRLRVEPEPANPSRIISKKAFGYILV
ncbi:MAG: winged helix-turn-helix domain-containing protein [Dehalococcoidia bacterium]|nr:winged helix-turn-helix domain-containing protein [Dehalococcoidia bacterium]